MSNEQNPSSGPPLANSNLIYIVDDECMVGDVVKIVLGTEGYTTKLFQDPELAWKTFQAEELKPALLLTDYVMSPINGMDLIDRCKKLQPDLRCILYSGNRAEDIFSRHSSQPDAFLRKPFLPSALLSTVRTALRDRERSLWPAER